jgi:oligogalacturonide lyase
VATKFWPPEAKSYPDRSGGRIVRQLTAHKGHSHHLHPMNSGWWDQGRKLLFGSDRLGKSNLYSVDLAGGGITQHTDADLPPESSFLFASANPVKPEAYFWRGNQLTAVDLVRNAERPIYRADANFATGLTSVTADGKFVCTAIYQNLTDRIPVDLLATGTGFREIFEAKPESRLMVIPTDGGAAKEVWRERNWVGHVSASPTQPNILTFIHEGPAGDVEQRMWGLDLRVGKSWAIRPRMGKGEQIEHAWWHGDGVQIGYHGKRAGGETFLGRTRFDVGQPVEMELSGLIGHVHSFGSELVVADGRREDGRGVLRLWRWNGVGYDGPRILCEHRGSFQVQQLHVHPRFPADGKKVVFTSDRSGYGQVYEVEIGSFDTLPLLSTV